MGEYSLKPELEACIKESVEAAKAAHFVMTPASMRESLLRTTLSQELPKVPMADVYDAVLDDCGEFDVPVRIYLPETGKPLPVLIYYHGGGFVVSSIMAYDPVCRRIAQATNHIVVSPAYRLAPENRYPAAEVDALAVAQHIYAKLDELDIPYITDLSVAGDSAGGYLAAVVSAKSQNDASLDITHQILFYPCLDMTASFPSFIENGIDKYGSNKNKMSWYYDNYLRDVKDRKAVSPVFGDLTAKMPKTMMVTVQFCPFRDEGVYYIQRLQKLGVPTAYYNATNMVHAYLNFEKLCMDEIQATYDKVAAFMKD